MAEGSGLCFAKASLGQIYNSPYASFSLVAQTWLHVLWIFFGAEKLDEIVVAHTCWVSLEHDLPLPSSLAVRPLVGGYRCTLVKGAMKSCLLLRRVDGVHLSCHTPCVKEHRGTGEGIRR